MVDTVIIGGAPLGRQQLAAVAAGARLELNAAAWSRIDNARAIVERIVANGERAYGITTGLGALCNVVLSPDQLARLSSNTLQSHACGVGEPLSIPLARALLTAQLQNYAHGHSGISPAVVQRLVDFLNLGITPVVPAGGSVGYLTHMAHAALPLIGLGEAWVEGERVPGGVALSRRGLEPLVLGAKDGLSLVNGTPCMTAFLAMALARAEHLAKWADVISAMSFEALKGQLAAFDAEALAVKPHPGALQVGANLRRLLADSANLSRHQGIRTQDALSIRSIPQIHGASRDQFTHIGRQVDIELASATDNPQVFGTPDDYRVVSQANPHGQSLGMAGDLLAIASAELAGVAERRIDRLVNPLVSGLPPFLLEDSGVNSGLMIVQYVAAALVAENKVLAHPMVVDNFVTSALQEDHLSLATPAVLKAHKVLDNVETVLAIEYLVAAQALHFFDAAALGQGSRAALAVIREHIPPYSEDRVVAPDITRTLGLLRDPLLLQRIETELGTSL
ncbi:histidine ammonia-lyase [Vogesella sp. LIG4]|uniref:HAL/PAL/TAL family ammonia-lyase n=1 Tax=Vogesella sp. LIG4 TaxID=1192162 RepID=UPI00081FEBC7|nr:histidine ammonia-lyase [Vogesella sp. LIG4]SCK14632.1 histidine ammonia-lyase [Vogesella sp. LIG4]